MTSAVLDHLWQSTLLALAAALLALAFRKARAAVRHGLWVAASVKFLVPFAVLEAVGKLLAPQLRAQIGHAPEAAFIATAADPFAQAIAVPPPAAAAAAAHLDPMFLLAAAWALGSAVVLASWIGRWTRLRRALRSATPLALPAPMPVLGSTSLLEPGLVGLWRPILLAPVTLFDHLSRPEIDAIVAHEACHLRRRDNLTAAIHMLVEALFWFHPMVWWIGARMIEERERACDEAVVSAGHDRLTYARSLVECCRLYLRSPLPCAAGASGAALQMRVDLILNAPPSARMEASTKALLAAAAAFVITVPVACGWLTSPELRQVAARVVALAARTPPVRAPEAAASPPLRHRASAQSRGGRSADAIASADGSAPPAPPAGDITAAAIQSQTPVIASIAAPAVRGPASLGAVAARLPDVSAGAPITPVAADANELGAEGRCYLVFGDFRCSRDPTPAARSRPAAAPSAAIRIASGPDAAEDPNRVLCAVQEMTGSRFVRRVCMTRDQWRQQQIRVSAAQHAWRQDPVSDYPAGYYW